MNCDEEQSRVNDLTEEVQTLQDSLEDAIPSQKPHIIARIDAAQAKLGVARADLEHCLAGTRLRAVLTASVELQTSNEQARGPFHVDDVAMPMLFEGDPLRLVSVSLPPIQPPPFPVPLGSNTTTISQSGTGGSTFERDTGRTIISVFLHFHHSIAIAGDSDLSVALTTEETHSPGNEFHAVGPRVDASGNVRLVAGGKFEGGFLGGYACLITVRGGIDPSPRV